MVPTLSGYPGDPSGKGTRGGTRMSGDAGRRPEVSVVTIVKNGIRTLPRAIESVASQEEGRIEHIIVDGGSTDGTLEVLRHNDNRIALWISEPDQGISDAFNKGIALARGGVIGILNCDDWYEPGALGAIATAMKESGADIACGALRYWDGDTPTYLVRSNPARLDRGMTIGHPTVFVRREAYERYGLFRLDFRLAMDYEWLLRAQAGGARFIAIDRCIANMQGGGVGDRRWRDSQREVAKARALHIPGADGPLARGAFVAWRIAIGTVRRALDATGLGAVRRAYHRWLSPTTITSAADD